jgi:hypothetical protein
VLHKGRQVQAIKALAPCSQSLFQVKITVPGRAHQAGFTFSPPLT